LKTHEDHVQMSDVARLKMPDARGIAAFHTNAGHVTLNDKAYNTERNVATAIRTKTSSLT
jgi:hypothetical protein